MEATGFLTNGEALDLVKMLMFWSTRSSSRTILNMRK